MICTAGIAEVYLLTQVIIDIRTRCAHGQQRGALDKLVAAVNQLQLTATLADVKEVGHLEVVTNNHVIKNGTEIRVVLSDKREFDAELVLTDERTDLAVLRIKPDGEPLVALALGDSDALEVGDLVLAIGNPFGVGQTVSSGIVSGLARSGGAGGAGRGYFIQTDAPINPGNSGGALIDVAGRLIGVNTQIVTRSGGSNGIGFAIPANLVAAFVSCAGGMCAADVSA